MNLHTKTRQEGSWEEDEGNVPTPTPFPEVLGQVGPNGNKPLTVTPPRTAKDSVSTRLIKSSRQ